MAQVEWVSNNRRVGSSIRGFSTCWSVLGQYTEPQVPPFGSVSTSTWMWFMYGLLAYYQNSLLSRLCQYWGPGACWGLLSVCLADLHWHPPYVPFSTPSVTVTLRGMYTGGPCLTLSLFSIFQLASLAFCWYWAAAPLRKFLNILSQVCLIFFLILVCYWCELHMHEDVL